ncbi:hypothetical protein Poly30_10080 [Planctomycetes bacterium Poly30]|uniref:Thioredoxin domain-containing protein n=1 Tax=Saltatorellus ferox TaxID=2528018 RepID=A0A518EN44_9BACT|nr:hypothetical protein Poly30_10080 [Planctomycetes bacterium Poly30]
MPSAIKTAGEYGDDLVVLFVEVQGATPEKAEKFAWDRKWMGTSAMWTTERPFNTGSKGIPNYALISASGELLMKGNPMSDHSKIMKAIDEEIGKAKKGPDDAPKSLKSAYKAFAKGDFAKAIAEAQKVADSGDEDAAAGADLVKTFQKDLEAKFKRVDWMLENAYLLEAEEQFEALEKGVKGLADFDERVAKLTETFGADDMKDQLKAAKSYAKIEATLAEDGLDEKALKKLEKFLEKNADAKIVARGQKLLKLGGK